MLIYKYNGKLYTSDDESFFSFFTEIIKNNVRIEQFCKILIESNFSFKDFINKVKLVDDQIIDWVINAKKVDEDLVADIAFSRQYKSWLSERIKALESSIIFNARERKIETELKDVINDENVDVVKTIQEMFEIPGDFSYLQRDGLSFSRHLIASTILSKCDSLDMEKYKDASKVECLEELKKEYSIATDDVKPPIASEIVIFYSNPSPLEIHEIC